MDLPEEVVERPRAHLNDFALIDEISGLHTFMNNFLSKGDIPETTRQRIASRMFTYQSEKPKEIALNEMRHVIFGGGR